MKTRREILCTIAGSSVIYPSASKTAKSENSEKLRTEATKLADLMQKACGGHWRVSVDKNLEFVLVQKVLA